MERRIAVMRKLGILFMGLYIGSIVLANWLVQRFGIIPIGFGLHAPAGVFAIGLTFPARDFIQRTLGKAWGIAGIGIGAGVSWLVSPVLAIASGVTFLFSETVDYAIYTPLQKRFGWAVIVSSCIAAIVDSLIFLKLAGIPYSVALTGQIIGKLEVIALVGLPLTLVIRKATLHV
jgi:uncharacterized PurR-regulated membrane protein YhhQ (DUF165 family)